MCHVCGRVLDVCRTCIECVCHVMDVNTCFGSDNSDVLFLAYVSVVRGNRWCISGHVTEGSRLVGLLSLCGEIWGRYSGFCVSLFTWT